MGSHDAVVPQNTKKLIIVNRPLLNNAEVPISILANDRTLVEALGLARSTVVRTFPADNVSILVLLQFNLTADLVDIKVRGRSYKA